MSLPAHIKHKEGYVEETKKTINRAGLNGQLVQRNNARPPIKEEINQLARSWCELLLGQVMEVKTQQSLTRAIEAKTIENIGIDHLLTRETYAVIR